ncbi:hypothetical protein [Mycolicibacterium sp.]|uniref:hypothetical protein n=1 Tax=Mycolicibacterium sp. TaxID=2320850 RepID=UPI0037C7F8E0
MSTDAKVYQSVIPVEPGTDTDQLKWLTRESFETTAAAEGLHVVAYSSSTVPASEVKIDDREAEKLPLPLDEYEWWLFTATAVPAERELPHLCGCCPHAPHEPGQCGGEDGYTVVDGKCSCPWPV